jgi:uroporphyrinogen decarboxylase
LVFCFSSKRAFRPVFERKVIEELPDGSRKVQNEDGVIVIEKTGAVSIPAEFDHLLKTRRDWEEHYLPRLQYNEDRILKTLVRVNDKMIPFGEGGESFLQKNERDYLYGLHCGSLIGKLRNITGVVGLSYIYADDPGLFKK